MEGLKHHLLHATIVQSHYFGSTSSAHLYYESIKCGAGRRLLRRPANHNIVQMGQKQTDKNYSYTTKLFELKPYPKIKQNQKKQPYQSLFDDITQEHSNVNMIKRQHMKQGHEIVKRGILHSVSKASPRCLLGIQAHPARLGSPSCLWNTDFAYRIELLK